MTEYGPGSCGRYASALNTPRGTLRDDSGTTQEPLNSGGGGVAVIGGYRASNSCAGAAAGAATLGGATAMLPLPLMRREMAERWRGNGVRLRD